METRQQQYKLSAHFSNNTSSDVTGAATWSVDSAYVTIVGGLVTAGDVTGKKVFKITASYTYKGITRTASQQVTLAEVRLFFSDGTVFWNYQDRTGWFYLRAEYGDGSIPRVECQASWELLNWIDHLYLALFSCGKYYTQDTFDPSTHVIPIRATYTYNGTDYTIDCKLTIYTEPEG